MPNTTAALVVSALILAASAGCGPNLGVPPKVCSTGVAVGGQTSPNMEPGGTCIGCHSSGEGPGFVVAGTVMNALHDDTNCSGVEGVTVRLTGADGRQLELVTNQSGNFFASAAPGTLTFPYRAEISRGGTVTPMLAARSAAETDCNGCHSAAGANAAPGRIVLP